MFLRWEGIGVDEVGKDSETGHIRVKVNPKYYRPADVVSSLVLFVFYGSLLVELLSS